MSVIDYAIIAGYMLAMIGIGFFFMQKQEGTDAYFVGDRQMGWGHVGLSVVATDVGGGFSIGLGGLGFAMGLSGSWLLFTGLVGAWATSVIVVPRVKKLGDHHGWTTYADFLGYHFDDRTRILAALVSAVGYASFVGAQVLAGATLLEGAFGVDRTAAVLVIAVVIVAYTGFGGIQAVIYTDTIQWIILLGGLGLVVLPAAIWKAGGIGAVLDALPADHMSLTNVSAHELVTWAITIIPIWFVANTLYQRIYAVRDVASARRAWYLAGLLEWPAMAFIGVALGSVARVIFPDLPGDSAELAVPMLIRDVLPTGVVGLALAVYFSAIMSTADSCLLASVGHLVGDFYEKHIRPSASESTTLMVARILTVVVGIGSVVVALAVPTVLDAILLTYSFMVSGLFAPTLGALIWPRTTALAAFASMLAGGVTAVALQVGVIRDALPGILREHDPALFAIPLSAVVLIVVSLVGPAPDGERSSERRQGGSPTSNL